MLEVKSKDWLFREPGFHPTNKHLRDSVPNPQKTNYSWDDCTARLLRDLEFRPIPDIIQNNANLLSEWNDKKMKTAAWNVGDVDYP